MKKNFTFLLGMFCLLFTTTSITAQVSGDYRSAVATGNWESASSWETYDGTNWSAALAFPAYTISNTVTVLNGHNITITGDVAFGSTQTYVPNTIVNSGGTITIAASKTKKLYEIIYYS